jgi:DNA repair protein RadA/Sms
VFVNVVGGMQITEIGWDLPAVLALASSLNDRVLPRALAVFGEIGLTGEVRPVAYGEERLKEAAKQGFERVIVARENAPRKPIAGLEVIPVSRVDAAVKLAFS